VQGEDHEVSLREAGSGWAVEGSVTDLGGFYSRQRTVL
jgi:hypothetical protein